MNARVNTKCVIAAALTGGQTVPVLTKAAFLEALEAAGATRADIARILNLAPPRATEIYKGRRDLSYEEARTLSEHYRINVRPLGLSEQAELEALLTEALRNEVGAGELFRELPGILVSHVVAYLSPPQIDPASRETPAPKSQADRIAERQPRAPSGRHR